MPDTLDAKAGAAQVTAEQERDKSLIKAILSQFYGRMAAKQKMIQNQSEERKIDDRQRERTIYPQP